MKIAIGSDHAGFELKEKLAKHLAEKYELVNVGTTSEDISVDYPDFAKKVSEEVLHDNSDFGILICGTGIGVSIAANKIEGIRAALVYDENTARLAKQHNKANVITLGGRTTDYNQAVKMVDAYIGAHFEERHQKRIDKITKLEEEGKVNE